MIITKFRLLLLLPLLAGCSDLEAAGLIGEPVQAASTTFNPAMLSPYGDDQPLEATQVEALNYLAYPQSHSAMRSLLGLPSSYDKTYDYFRVGDGSWVAIEYNPEGFAVAHSQFRPE